MKPVPRRLAFLVAACFFMENLDVTIVTTALPTIASELGVGTPEAAVLVSSYLVALAVFIPLGGWLLTRLQARTVFVAAIVVFTLASLGCGFAQDLGTLTSLRVLQGAGGALMVPVGRQLVLRDAPKQDIPRLIAYIVWPGLVAPVIAPFVGGVITTHVAWEWIFWINVPLGIIATIAAIRLTPRTVEGERTAFDVLGFVLVAVGLGGLTWGAQRVVDGAWDAPIWGGAAVVALVVGILHLRRTPHPVIDLGVLRDRVFATAQLGQVAYWIAVGAVPYLLPLLLQQAYGWDPVQAGLLVMWVFVGNIGIKPATTPLLNRFSYRSVLVVSAIALAVVTVALALVPPEWPSVVLAVLALLSGVFRSVALTAFATIGFATIANEERRAANTVNAVIVQVASGFGVSIASVGLAFGVWSTGETARPAFLIAFALVSVGALASAIVMSTLPRGSGDELRTVRRA
ncbi:MFS transporter [Pseudoclavibacter chungangensis]|uniref:MFS transporter n=1 Tax=Pseudoclavibacter chungangensis TaxID=587635 RepID=A0A7J5BRJ5_9MICO|nr:MFS transporter [Pseudoclavibacter chungangensis]KAB1656355.1 MFS transporter [Pseudoclavibacter chungangensis]NYJ67127.1 EmrB/QacA subfamily drug resistance transporter [Pseudoclavibacter chungangensis]